MWCCRMRRSQTEKPAPGWQLEEPAQLKVLLTDVAGVARPVVVDRPYLCDVDVKHVYIQPRPHSTHPNATHEHTGEREEKALTRRECSTTRHSALVSL